MRILNTFIHALFLSTIVVCNEEENPSTDQSTDQGTVNEEFPCQMVI